jgi:hypothetical protein
MGTIKREKLSRRPALDDMDVADVLSFLAGWQPPLTEFDAKRDRWQTWSEFFGEYELLRVELLSSDWAASVYPGEPIFAEEQFKLWTAAGRPAEWRRR